MYSIAAGLKVAEKFDVLNAICPRVSDIITMIARVNLFSALRRLWNRKPRKSQDRRGSEIITVVPIYMARLEECGFFWVRLSSG
ncbi:MAG: hypothetical protein HS101_08020 [Planctomycetia bacterium]|nr:hypothetical protein [Planctomycetia bacterium]